MKEPRKILNLCLLTMRKIKNKSKRIKINKPKTRIKFLKGLFKKSMTKRRTPQQLGRSLNKGLGRNDGTGSWLSNSTKKQESILMNGLIKI